MLTIVEFLKNVGVGLGVIGLIILAAVALVCIGELLMEYAIIVGSIVAIISAWGIGSGLRS